MSAVSIHVPLSKLVGNRRNPRRVKPERDAHRRLVASIRAHGLLEPLVVRPARFGSSEQAKHYQVIAGNRRLIALREVHKGEDAEVVCVVREADDQTADAMSLSENFVREPMHPLDEAEAFAKLARDEAKGAEAIAAEFGVSEHYVRQRMKLATLTGVVKIAFRAAELDTATAEAFATVPADRQLEVWQEVNGKPQHAHHVRNVIANTWIEADHALFDLSTLPESAVSRDLFNDRVLVERKAFLDAQADALIAERQQLTEDGWNEVVLSPQAQVQDRLWSMVTAEPQFDEQTNRKLAAIQKRREKIEAKFEDLDENDEDRAEAFGRKFDELDRAERAATDAADVSYAEATKAHGTAFLILDPDGRVRREFRLSRKRFETTQAGGHAESANDGPIPQPAMPTSDDLCERQRGTTFTHEALAVREALLGDELALKRVLVLALHDKVRGDALSIRREANGTDLHADHAEGFASTALNAIRERRAKIDPLLDGYSFDEREAYGKLRDLTADMLDELVRLLTVECVTAHLVRVTPLVRTLASELGVNVRRHWRPDATWLNGYRKCQLAHLLSELRGPVYGPAAEKRKKSELVDALAKLFADAADGRLDDATAKANEWLPSNLREPVTPQDAADHTEA